MKSNIFRHAAILAALISSLALSSPAYADCASPSAEEGVMMYNTTYKTMQFCDGNNWWTMKGGSTASLPIGCNPGEMAQWNGTLWTCASGGGSLTFINQTDVGLDSTITSNTITVPVSGTATCGAGCTGISRNGGAFEPGPVAGFIAGDTIAIQQTASGSLETATTASVTVGSITSNNWTVTTTDATQLTLSSSTNDYNLYNAAVAAGWTSGIPVKLTINSGVVVGSTSTAAAALIVGGFPAGTPITIVNDGYVVGRGGNGGHGGCFPDNCGAGGAGTAGTSGGPAFDAQQAVTITNNGIIGGGGGGAGGGSATGTFSGGGSLGCGAGGGAGAVGGSGGHRGGGSYPIVYAEDGTVTAAGAPICDSNPSSASGALGQPGAAGNAGHYGGGAGGQAGAAVLGNANVTWTLLGDIRGALQ